MAQEAGLWDSFAAVDSLAGAAAAPVLRPGVGRLGWGEDKEGAVGFKGAMAHFLLGACLRAKAVSSVHAGSLGKAGNALCPLWGLAL